MITWINDKVGTAPFCSLSTADRTRYAVVDVRTLVDGAGNPKEQINYFVESATKSLRGGRATVICCDMGVSRSNTIAAAAIARAFNTEFDTALQQVRKATNNAAIKRDLVRDVRIALGGLGEAVGGGRVFVTGASGFIGSALRSSDSEIWVPHERGELDLVSDAVGFDAFIAGESIGHIIHLAHPRLRSGNAAFGESLAILRALLETAKAHKLGFTYVSSLCVFDGCRTASGQVCLSANTPLKAATAYGQAKWFGERLVKHYIEEHNVLAHIARPAAVYGVGMPSYNVVQKFLAMAQQGQNIVTHRYQNIRPAFDFIHVDDVVAALRQLISLSEPVTVNLGFGRLFSTFDLANLCLEVAGNKANVSEMLVDKQGVNLLTNPAEAAICLPNWQPKVSLMAGLKNMLCDVNG